MFLFLVIKFLNGIKFFGRPLTIVLSKHTQVQMPKEGADAEKLTQVRFYCTYLTYTSYSCGFAPGQLIWSNKLDWHEGFIVIVQ